MRMLNDTKENGKREQVHLHFIKKIKISIQITIYSTRANPPGLACPVE